MHFDALHEALAAIRVVAMRMHLHTPDVEATVPMLRGVWGAALRRQSLALYRDVFEGRSGEEDQPRYIVRPARPYVMPRPAVEFVLINPEPDNVPDLLFAWEDALAKGLGKQRVPALTVWRYPLRPDVQPSVRHTDGFTLKDANWPLSSDVPCDLHLVSPLRILRNKTLVEQPTLHDLVVATLRRIEAYCPPALGKELAGHRNDFLAISDDFPTGTWQGRRRDFQRWSARQGREVEQEGVVGTLPLPAGSGPLSELLAAALWLHIGKGTVMGLGQVVPSPVELL
ncbi:CRISPR system precrRNA processing endoribonuclease RAMP protein Cas6 [bacterium]|nr:CRISPR system precrRNA processing endoribonuclease RAMP protein Cas6 [bacterium]